MPVKTHALLGTAYRPNMRPGATARTHAVDTATGLPLCGRINPWHFADEHATNPDLPATCPTCAKRDPRRTRHANDGPFLLKSLMQW